MTNPVLVEVLRAGAVESHHRGAVAVVDAEGKTVLAIGDIDRAIYPRSAIKGLQALPLIETGAADRYGLSDAEIALACASHNGEDEHVALAASMLTKTGLTVSSLECGSHWPMRDGTMRALAKTKAEPSALHNNCSGKHAGFLCVACMEGHDPKGYIQPDHPTMRMVTTALEEMTGIPLSGRTDCGVDGCSIPTYAMPLRGLAQAFARFGTGHGLAPDRAEAARRIRAAVAAAPFSVAGTQRFDTLLMSDLGARAFVKVGAEGVYCAAFPELGYGVSLKCDDGSTRAAEVMMAAVVHRLLPLTSEDAKTLNPLLTPILKNWNGHVVGGLRPAGPLAVSPAAEAV